MANLDQAIAYDDMEGEATVSAAQVRVMLGLSAQGGVRGLFGHVLEGNACEVLSGVQEQHVLGVEPLALMRGLLEICHAVTVAKTGREDRSEEHTSELQSLMRISYAVFCLKKKLHYVMYYSIFLANPHAPLCSPTLYT